MRLSGGGPLAAANTAKVYRHTTASASLDHRPPFLYPSAAMCRLLHTLALLGTVLASNASAAGPDADATRQPDTCAVASASSADTVVVLHDGGVLVGHVSQRDGRYVVESGHGEISVSATQVMLVATSLENAYQQQRRVIERPTVEAHLRLAEWCLRNNLGPQAARELIDARGLDPRHPKLPLLERRLAALAAQSARETARPTVAAADNPLPDDTVPHAELERLTQLAETLPDGALEQFTRKVQPLLVNSCTTSGCHQPGSEQSFQLDRAMLHGLSNRRSTLRNLEATLKLVDRDAPLQSELLVLPRGPHGGMNGPVFGPRQEQLTTHLSDWVAVVTQTDVPAVPDAATLASQDQPPPIAGPVQQSVYERRQPGLAEPIRRVPLEAPPRQAAANVAPDRSANTGVVPVRHEVESLLGPPRPLQYGAHLSTWQPKDPFDAEIFNRETQRAEQVSVVGVGAVAPATR